MQTGKFLQPWKEATIIPILEKKDKSSVANYRPVSLLNIVSKILQKSFLIESTSISKYTFTHPSLASEKVTRPFCS